ncbi:MAG: outer membrane lipoprotein-sorting protein [Oleispira sp.]|nr:outer membrane lipoprotein-sorting protein [Oleispira sp.]|tara:strand:+ start:4242 stop:5597 length:1356 start_codon:yes stop_codon:yes gene_type:complete
MEKFMLKIITFFFVYLFAWNASAQVSDKDIARLGKDLTPVGAERKGNGSDIPAWTGGLQQSKSHESGSFHSDPYFRDKPLFKINSKNIEQHKDRLSFGSQQLLKQFPSMEMPVYKTHRSASYPDYVYEGIKNNAHSANLIKYGSGVQNSRISSPFPIPESGLEVLWNHTLRFRGQSLNYIASTVHVNSGGSRAVTVRDYKYYFAYSDPELSTEDLNNKIFFLKRKTLAPSRIAGGITLVHETLDQIRSPRKSWIYVPGQRRVRRTPDLNHDTPDGATNSLRTVDQVDMFNGAPDYYDWKLIGKQEMYIPYNAYSLNSPELTVEDITGPAHLNPQHLRYEAHRVWVVEANLRLGFDHRYAKRRYYFDEDSWSIVYAEEYDEDGKLWQFTESHLVNYYDVPVVFHALEVTYDLKDDTYFVEGIDNDRSSSYDFSVEYSKKEFTTSAVRREAKR